MKNPRSTHPGQAWLIADFFEWVYSFNKFTYETIFDNSLRSET